LAFIPQSYLYLKIQNYVNLFGVAIRESRLLDSIGSAQVEQEVIKKIMPLLHSRAQNIEEETGIQPSLTDKEARQHLEDALEEVRKSKKE
jgi:hypothetical protein